MSFEDRHFLVTDDAFPLVYFNTYFEGGPSFDPPGLEGLTCLTNRLLIRGTTSHNRADFEDMVESMGTELVTSTRPDSMTLGGTVLAQYFDRFVHCLGDAISSPRFEREEFEKSRREMISDLELMVDEDGHLARHCLGQLIHHGSPLSTPALGSLDSLSHLTLDAVRRRHQETYVRSRLWTSAGGHLGKSELHQVLDSAFRGVPEGTSLPVEPMKSTRPQGRRIFFIHKPERSQTQIMIGQPSVAASHPGFHALQVMTSAFGGQFSSRLMQELRVKRGLSYGAHAWVSNHRFGGDYILNASVDSVRVMEAISVLFEQLELVVEGGMSDDELCFARDHLRKSHPFMVETAALQASYGARAALSGLGRGAQAEYLRYLTHAAPEQVRAQSASLLSANDFWVVMVGTLTSDLERTLSTLPGVTGVLTRSYDQVLKRPLLP